MVKLFQGNEKLQKLLQVLPEVLAMLVLLFIEPKHIVVEVEPHRDNLKDSGKVIIRMLP